MVKYVVNENTNNIRMSYENFVFVSHLQSTLKQRMLKYVAIFEVADFSPGNNW